MAQETKSQCEISMKVAHIRLYGTHPDKYSSHFHLYLDGRRGYLWALMGKDFYKQIAEHLSRIFKECGIDSIEASMLGHHADFMERMLGHLLHVDKMHENKVAGRRMAWVRLSLK